jgi:hypothetical protein
MIEVICNDRLGKKVRVKCNEDDTIGDLKKLIAQVRTKHFLFLMVAPVKIAKIENGLPFA